MVCEGLHRCHASALRHAKSQRNKEIPDGVRIRFNGQFIPSFIKGRKLQQSAIAYGLPRVTFGSHLTVTGSAPLNGRFHKQSKISGVEETENNLANTQKTPQATLGDLMALSYMTLWLMTGERDNPEAICKLSKCINKQLTWRTQNVSL